LFEFCIKILIVQHTNCSLMFCISMVSIFCCIHMAFYFKFPLNWLSNALLYVFKKFLSIEKNVMSVKQQPKVQVLLSHWWPMSLPTWLHSWHSWHSLITCCLGFSHWLVTQRLHLRYVSVHMMLLKKTFKNNAQLLSDITWPSYQTESRDYHFTSLVAQIQH